MKSLNNFLITIALLISGELLAQTPDSLKRHAIGLADQGLYSEAIQKMSVVYTLAKSQNNDSMMIGALYYRIKWVTGHQENLLDTLIKDCEEISLKENGLLRNFVHLWLGNLYQQYYWSNQDLVQDGVWNDMDNKPDFRKWSKSRLYDAAEFHLNAAMEGDLDVPVAHFKEVVDISGVEDIIYRPTLYEVFFDRWLEFHVQRYHAEDSFSEEGLQTDTLLFLTGADFLADIQKYAGKKNYMERILFQIGVLLNRQIKNGKYEAYLDYELSRLKLVFDYVLHHAKDNHFEHALNKLLDTNKFNAALHLIYAQMAEYAYRSKGDAATALKFCARAINEFPESYGAKKCRLIRNDILRPEISVSGNQIALPGNPYVSYVTVRNIPELFLRIVKIPALHQVRRDDAGYLKALLKASKTVYSSSYAVSGTAPYVQVTADYKIPSLPIGKYLLVWSDQAQPEQWKESSPVVTSVFHVTTLGYFNYSGQDSLHVVVFNRKTGNGISEASMELDALEYTYNGLKSAGRYFLRSDKSGMAAVKWDKPYLIKTKLWKGRDTLELESQQFAGIAEKGDRSYRYIELYTDRSIYRPGQIIYFKGLMLTDPGTGIKSTMAYKRVEVVLYDASNEKIISGDFTANATGAFSGSFIIPEDRLLGTYYIQAATSDGIAGSRAVVVEAYKRPSFYVELLNKSGEKSHQDSMIVSGKVIHFDLSPVSGAEFTYQIYRLTPFLYFSPEIRGGMTRGQGNLSLYLSGEGVTDSDGGLEIRFQKWHQGLKPSSNFPNDVGYRIEVTVTDMNGETQSGKTDIYPGYENYDIKVSWPEKSDVYKLPPLDIELSNHNGPVNGAFKIYRLKKDPGKLFKQLRHKYQQIQGFDPWIHLQQCKDSLLQLYEADEIYTGRLTDPKMEAVQNLIKGGIYLVMAVPEGNTEQKKSLSTLHLFSDIERGITLGDAPWSFLMKKNTYAPGEISLIKCAGSQPGQQMYIIIEKNGLVLEAFHRKISSGQMISLPVEKQYSGDVFLHLVYARNGEFFRDTLHLKVPPEHRKINLEMVSGIKTLKPGNDVTFSFRTETKDIDLSKTELLACMYDASLDQFTSHFWASHFDQPSYSYLMLASPGFDRLPGDFLYPGWNFRQDTVHDKERRLPQIKWPSELYRMYDQVMYRNPVSGMPDRQPDMLAAESQATDNMNMPKSDSLPESKGSGIFIRQDFRETAFFYPHVKVDSSGGINVQCKVPDALTKWRLMLFAHSESAQTGYFEEVFSTTMDAVIFPNTPRFIIIGDSIAVTAKLANHLNTDIDGHISLDILDPLTGDTINSVIKTLFPKQTVSLAGNSSANYSWNIKAGVDLPGYVRFVFRYAGSYSGDEIQVEIPVQSPLQLQRMTRPFVISVHTARKLEFPIEELLASDQTIPVQFSVELAQNPLWFAIQALPYMEEREFESSDQLMQRLFGYQMAIEILGRYPYLPELFSNVTSGDEQQRDDLRISRTLQTPWNMSFVQKRKSQQEILHYFNLNQCKLEIKEASNKLKKYQHHEGGFSWFPQGRPDLFLTLNVLEACGRLHKISGNKEHRFMDDDAVRRALDFSKSQLLNLIKQDSVQFPEWALYFAFVRAFYADSIKDKDERELLQRIVNHYESRWSEMNIYHKAMYGKVCLGAGNKTGKKIAESLLKQSVYSPEKGRYWNAGTGYRWTDLPVERQVVLMEFFTAAGGYEQEIKQMAHWLIMQKRIQDWSTPRASMGACYGIFLLEHQGRLDEFDVVISNKNGIVNEKSKQQKTGYFRKDWYGSQIDSNLSSWEFDIPTGRLAWGGLFSSFWNRRENIRSDAVDDLKLTKEVFKVNWSKDTLKLEKLHKSDTLEVGDRVRVVFYVESRSSFEYVHLRDPVFSGLQVVRSDNGYRYTSNLSVYCQYTEENVDMFIDFLPKGSYTLYYDGMISHSGKFIQSSAHMSSHFAPEFSASSGSFGPVHAKR